MTRKERKEYNRLAEKIAAERDANDEKTIEEIRVIMAKPCPCKIESRLPQPPTSDEQAEFGARNTASTDYESDEQTG